MYATLLACATLFGGAIPSRGANARWFELGHRVVARIAETRLTPHAAAAVRDLLGGQSMADASAWADLIRGRRPDTSPLHFVNIPLNATAYDSARDCRASCIISAIENERRTLADPAASTVERAEALRFLIHLIADLHQPLHVSDNGDKGGNLTQVQFAGKGTNLHKVWDGELIEAAGMDDAAYLGRLRQQMATQDLTAFETGSVVDWAMEGHRVAAENAYRIPRNRHLDEAYLDANLPVVDLAIIKAGVRLAKVLNEALASYQPARAGPSLGPGMYSDREAAAHAGEEAMVVGTVVTVHRTDSGNLYLNFGADYPHQTFSGAILEPRDPALQKLDGLIGKRVGIRGRIRIYKGQAEVLIERRDQIIEVP